MSNLRGVRVSYLSDQRERDSMISWFMSERADIARLQQHSMQWLLRGRMNTPYRGSQFVVERGPERPAKHRTVTPRLSSRL